MQLTYRGNFYEVPTPIQLSSDSTEQPKIKLTYRRNIYYSTPCSVVVRAVDKTDWSTVTLRYRGNTYQRKIQPSQLDQKPPAIN